MNANHARPLAAFWLLALAAAVVTAVGLRADSGEPAIRPAPPSRVSASGAPELVLGGVLRAVSSLTGSSAPVLPTPAATPAVETTAAQVAAPRTSNPDHEARNKGSGHSPSAGHASSTPSATPVSETGHGKAKGRHKTHEAKSTATATTSPRGHGGPPPGRGKAH